MSTVNDPNPPFNASRVIVLSELSTREKDKYYDLLLSNQTKFYFDKNLNKYVGNVRLLGPQGKRSDYEDKKRDVIVSSLPFEERLKRLQDGNPISVRIQGAEKFDYNEFVKFTVLVASNGDVVKPKQRTLSWLMRTIEELFDSRFAFEKIDIERDEALSTSTSFGDPNSAANAGKRAAVNIFPVFVIRRMCTLVGLKALVDQTCWDMLYNIHLYRQDYLEVELFARFLKEHYDYDDLLFFLYVRSVISKTLNINFRARWNGKTDVNVNTGQICSTPATLYLSYRECVRIANIIYGSQGNEAICKRFIAMVTSQLVGQVTETTDSRRMDITQFLHLAVIGYHYAQNMMNLDNPPAGPGPAGGAVDETGRYVSHELEMDPSGQEIEYSSNSDLNPQGTYQDMAIGSQANAEHQDQEMYRELELEEEEARLNHEYFQPNPEQFDNYMQDMLEIRKNPDNIRNLVQEHNSVNAEEVYPETDPSIPDEDVGLPSERQEFVGEDVPNSIENINEGNVGADDQQSLATSNWTVSSDDFIQLQMDREKEFLEYICEPLEALVMQAQENGGDEHEMLIAAEMAQKIVDEVADQLRNEVNKQLVGFEPTSLEDFDNKLVDILQARELITQLEEVRDNMFAQEVSGNNIQEPVVESEVVSVPDIAALEEIGVDAKLEEPPGDIQNPNISAIQSELPTASISAPPSTRPSTAGSSSSLTVDSYSNLQKDRESEFLELLCQPLDVLPTDTQVAVKHELSIALRVKLNEALHGVAPDDLGHYDEIIVDVLQSERFLEEMETLTVELMDKMAPNLASGTPQGEGGEEVTNGQITN